MRKKRRGRVSHTAAVEPPAGAAEAGVGVEVQVAKPVASGIRPQLDDDDGADRGYNARLLGRG